MFSATLRVCLAFYVSVAKFQIGDSNAVFSDDVLVSDRAMVGDYNSKFVKVDSFRKF